MELVPTPLAQRLQPSVTVAELLDHVSDDARSCVDHRDIRLADTRVLPDGAWRYNGEAGRLTRHSLGQVCARLELPTGGTVPASYLARCPSDLAADNLNHWLERVPSDQRVFVRTRQTNGWDRPTVRAVVSDRYAPVDHLPLLRALEDLVPRHNLSVQGWSLDEERFTLRLHVGTDHPASLDDPIRVGMHISNSEIGLGRISLSALVTRLVCSNGLVVTVADLGGVHRKHIGRAGEDLEFVVRSALPTILANAEEAGDRFVRLRSLPAPKPLDDFLRKTAAEAELLPTVVPDLEAIIEGDTLYDVVNAFTRVAQRHPVTERVRIESMMSQFLREPRSRS